MAGVTYRDEIVIYRVIGPVAEEGRAFLAKLEWLKAEFDQQEILIVERAVEML